MSRHRWWLAFIATLLTPWLGPHVDRYVPIGWVLLQSRAESPDWGFWVIAALFLAVAYFVWFMLLTGIAVLLR